MASDFDGVGVELSVLIPVYNEADNLSALLDRLTRVLKTCVASYEIVFIDDGSKDESVAKLKDLSRQYDHLRIIAFSRNFGKEIAIIAGIDAARGRAAVIMDADLQHPPETIAQFVALWRQGYQNIYGVRQSRLTDSPARKYLSLRFYRLFRAFGEIGLPEGAGDFRLLDAAPLQALRQLRERARFSKGLYAWVGFKSIGVPFEVAERHAGVSKFSYFKLTRFAFDGLMSFSSMPLMVWTYIGTIISICALMSAVYFVGEAMVLGAHVPGYASLIVSIMFFAGVQLFSLGILGEYISRIFNEVKGRPLYIIAEEFGASDKSLMTDTAWIKAEKF